MATRVPSEDIDTEPPGVVARSLAVDVGAHLGPRPAALGVHPHVAGVMPLPSLPERCTDRHARAVRGHRYRPRMVARSLAVDVGAHLGPRPAALRVHPHVAGLLGRRRYHERRSPRACRPRTSIPRTRTVARSLAVDIRANLFFIGIQGLGLCLGFVGRLPATPAGNPPAAPSPCL